MQRLGGPWRAGWQCGRWLLERSRQRTACVRRGGREWNGEAVCPEMPFQAVEETKYRWPVWESFSNSITKITNSVQLLKIQRWGDLVGWWADGTTGEKDRVLREPHTFRGTLFAHLFFFLFCVCDSKGTKTNLWKPPIPAALATWEAGYLQLTETSKSSFFS